MGQALYRKYRSKSLDAVIGQDHITQTLSQAVKSGRISHAYLFSGPRGVGKTSIARILAHDINNLPYDNESPHIDIIEIDAASNGLVDEVRDLREKVYIAPALAKYKVYIIDEAHMMSAGAFNALLKTLEEPPAHAVFILATTAPNKLPDTIISRTQRFQFRPIDQNKVIDHLSYIAKQENIKIDAAALKLIAEHGQGSFRDSISLLDQAASSANKVTADTINALLGMPPENLISNTISALEKGDSSGLISALTFLFEQGYPSPIIATQLSAKLRLNLINNTSNLSRLALLDLLARLIEVSASEDPDKYLEISLLKTLPDLPLAKSTPSNETKDSPPEKAKQNITEVKSAKPEKIPKEPTPKISKDQPMDQASWSEVLAQLRSKYNTLYGVVRMADVSFNNPGVITLSFAWPFHQKRIKEPKNSQIILTAAKQVTGKDFDLDCIVDKSLLNKPTAQPEPADLDIINSIFGGGEVID